MNTNPMENDVIGRIHLGDNIEVLRALPAASVDLIYIDPPFNTGKVQERTQLKTVRSERGDRVGFQLCEACHKYQWFSLERMMLKEPERVITDSHEVLAP